MVQIFLRFTTRVRVTMEHRHISVSLLSLLLVFGGLMTLKLIGLLPPRFGWLYLAASTFGLFYLLSISYGWLNFLAVPLVTAVAVVTEALWRYSTSDGQLNFMWFIHGSVNLSTFLVMVFAKAVVLNALVCLVSRCVLSKSVKHFW